MSDAFEKAIDDAEAIMAAAGHAKVKANAMEERRRRVRATLFVKYRGTGKGAAESMEMAIDDPVYELACVDYENAAYEAETLIAKAKANEMKFEAWRTRKATERAQMNLR